MLRGWKKLRNFDFISKDPSYSIRRELANQLVMHRIIDKIKPGIKTRATAFFATAFIGITAAIMLMSSLIGDSDTIKLRLLLFSADSAIILSPYWLLKPRWRWTILPLAWIISLFLEANVLYFRYWHDLIPLSAVFIPANYNSLVFDSVPSLISAVDSFFFLIPAIITVAYFAIRPWHTTSYTVPAKVAAIVLSIMLYAGTLTVSIDSSRRWNLRVGKPETNFSDLFMRRFSRKSSQFDMWKNHGLTAYVINQLIYLPDMRGMELTPTERQSLTDYLKEVNATHDDSTALTCNRNKNLIFIIVESLNAWVIDKRYGDHELTPELNRLIHADNVISSTSMIAQINDGSSSDGQLIYNTGLLPLKSGIAAQSFGDNRFLSLCKAIAPESSAEFIVESSRVFNHRVTSKSYGYGQLHDLDSLTRAIGWAEEQGGADAAVLNYAFDKILTMPQPFIAEITTLSMHYPFSCHGIRTQAWIDSLTTNSDYERRYLQTVHYADQQIGRFVKRLKQSPLAGNTIVVIASDHDAPTTISDGKVDESKDLPIVFIALGTGITKRHDEVMGQIDVFPTLLDIMGVTIEQYPWRGLGKSIIGDSVKAAISRTGRLAGEASETDEQGLRRAFEVSDSLIRSDFFAN